METQLDDMFSSHYCSTRGYDEEQLDYLSFIEDDIICELFPEPIKRTKLRRSFDTEIAGSQDQTDRDPFELADICRLIASTRKHCHEKYALEERTAILHQMAEQELYDYQKVKPFSKFQPFSRILVLTDFIYCRKQIYEIILTVPFSLFCFVDSLHQNQIKSYWHTANSPILSRILYRKH